MCVYLCVKSQPINWLSVLWTKNSATKGKKKEKKNYESEWTVSRCNFFIKDQRTMDLCAIEEKHGCWFHAIHSSKRANICAGFHTPCIWCQPESKKALTYSFSPNNYVLQTIERTQIIAINRLSYGHTWYECHKIFVALARILIIIWLKFVDLISHDSV